MLGRMPKLGVPHSPVETREKLIHACIFEEIDPLNMREPLGTVEFSASPELLD